MNEADIRKHAKRIAREIREEAAVLDCTVDECEGLLPGLIEEVAMNADDYDEIAEQVWIELA